MLPSKYAHQNGIVYSSSTAKEHKKGFGQFLTPLEIAAYMASLATSEQAGAQEKVKICDPGCGHGILTCCLVEKLVGDGVTHFEIDVFEIDGAVLETLTGNLTYLRHYYADQEIIVNYQIHREGFLTWFYHNRREVEETYDFIIANPPYFKLNRGDENVLAIQDVVPNITNIYAGFMAASIRMVKVSGTCIFIVPRSFSAGLYFKSLRQFLFKESRIKHVHLFDSRTKTFKEDGVLQETVILKLSSGEGTTTKISTSEGIADLNVADTHTYQVTDLVDLDSEDQVLHLPSGEENYMVICKMRRLTHRLTDHGIRVSTGRVVAFRAKAHLRKTDNESVVPLIWNRNIQPFHLSWPLEDMGKPQYISCQASSQLVPSGNYVLQRRFSAKEDKNRLVCAPILQNDFDFEYLGFENKTNFFYRVGHELEPNIVYGLCALLNSSIYNTYFRMINGNINVSATEMRLLPMPSLEKITAIGKIYRQGHYELNQLDELIEQVVFEASKSAELV